MRYLIVMWVVVLGYATASDPSPDSFGIKAHSPYRPTKDGNYTIVDYSDLMKNITCSVKHANIEELQFGLLYMEYKKFIIFALATVNENRTDFTVEHVINQWVESVRVEMNGEWLTLVVNVWAMFRRLSFACKVVPTADIPSVSKEFNIIKYNGLISVWAWADTSSLNHNTGDYAVHMSCPSTRVTRMKLELLRMRKKKDDPFGDDEWMQIADVSITSLVVFKNMFPAVNGRGFSSTRLAFSVRLSYEPDGRLQFNVIDRVSLTETTHRVFRQTGYNEGSSTSWEFKLPIVDVSDPRQPAIVADTSHVWQKGNFTVTCSINNVLAVIKSIKLTASEGYPDTILETRAPFDVATSPPTVISSMVTREPTQVVVRVVLQHNTIQRSAFVPIFTCTADTDKGVYYSANTTVVHMWTTRPQRLVGKWSLVPSISGKARISVPRVVTTADTAKFDCTLVGEGEYLATWEVLDVDSGEFVSVDGKFPDYPSPGGKFLLVNPPITYSGIYRCRISSTQTSAFRLSREANFTVIPYDNTPTSGAFTFVAVTTWATALLPLAVLAYSIVAQ